MTTDQITGFYQRSLASWLSAEGVQLTAPAFIVMRLPEMEKTGNEWTDRLVSVHEAYNRHVAVDVEMMQEAGQEVVWATYDGKTWALDAERVPVEGHESS